MSYCRGLYDQYIAANSPDLKREIESTNAKSSAHQMYQHQDQQCHHHYQQHQNHQQHPH